MVILIWSQIIVPNSISKHLDDNILEEYYHTEPRKTRSRQGEIMGNHLSLWVKVKDRSGPGCRPPLREIAEWCKQNNIQTEIQHNASSSMGFERTRLLYADQFYLGVFPIDKTEWVAAKIVWGEYLETVDFTKL